MKKIRTLITIILFALFAGGMLWFYALKPDRSEEVIASEEDTVTIRIWYTDEALTDYLTSASVAYLEEYGVRVIPELHTGLEYLEEIDSASFGEEIPDLYIMGTDSTEKAVMAGLALPVLDEKGAISLINYPQVALNSVTYKNEVFGYPFYFDTAFLLYNQTYLKQMADRALRKEIGQEVVSSDSDSSNSSDSGDADDEDGGMSDLDDISLDNPPEGYDPAEWDVLVSERMEKMIPTSIQDVLNFANSYSAPDNVENIFLWDVNDIFYNYFFMGAYMNVGGEYGDDPTIVDVYNPDTVQCMQVYQGLHQFFSIESSESNYKYVLDTFLQGKTIFMIATTDAVSSIVEAQHEGTFYWEYSVTSLPGVDADHASKGLSTTSAIYINGYTQHRAEADAFARFVAVDNIDSLFQRTGKLSAANVTEDYVDDAADLARDMYKVSQPLPKILQLSDFWIELELVFVKIWDGADVEETLADLQSRLQVQIDTAGVSQDTVSTDNIGDDSASDNTVDLPAPENDISGDETISD